MMVGQTTEDLWILDRTLFGYLFLLRIFSFLLSADPKSQCTLDWKWTFSEQAVGRKQRRKGTLHGSSSTCFKAKPLLRPFVCHFPRELAPITFVPTTSTHFGEAWAAASAANVASQLLSLVCHIMEECGTEKVSKDCNVQFTGRQDSVHCVFQREIRS